MIVRVNVVLNRTFVDSDCAVVIFRVKVSCITLVDGIKRNAPMASKTITAELIDD